MITFYKYQGTGNDFILIDDRNKQFDAGNKQLIEKLCNRRFGIGADGLILLQHHNAADFYMQYFNSDGAESTMCGNGGRCIAQFAFDIGAVNGDTCNFYAIDGHHTAHKLNHVISLQMIDVNGYHRIEENIFELNTGSPHYVKFESEINTGFHLIENARAIRYNDTYRKNGINVNFIKLNGLKSIDIRTYERGVEDETLSCGTGVTAAALSTAVFNNLPQGEHEITVNSLGGELKVKFKLLENNFTNIWLTGAATFVYKGQINIQALS